jgi:hypothetical protein
MHLTPTAGFQNINIDIWKQIVEGGLYKYPIKNISRTAMYLPTFGTYALKSVKHPGNTFNLAKGGQELCRPWYIFYGIFIETPLHNLFSNIKIDILKPCCGREVHYPT